MDESKGVNASESERGVRKKDMLKNGGAVPNDGVRKSGDDGLAELLDRIAIVVSSSSCSSMKEPEAD
jgi:hypothetical protein